MQIDDSLTAVLYVAIGIGLVVVLIYAGRQFVAGIMEAKREHDARAQARPGDSKTSSAAEQVVRRRR
jgi:hypothetical protein